MPISRTQAILARVVPTILLVGLAVWVSFAAKDVLEAWDQVEASRRDLVAVERENDRYVLEGSQLAQDPIQVERRAADALGLARPGTTLYVFEDDEIVRVH